MIKADQNSREFERICRNQLRFLENEYGFELVKTEREPYGVYMTYQNRTTALRISLEPAEGGIFVLLSKLVSGKIPRYPIFVKPRTQLHSFYLNDIVQLKASKGASGCAWRKASTAAEISTSLGEIAILLRTFASDILSGDFSVFVPLDRVVKARARSMEIAERPK